MLTRTLTFLAVALGAPAAFAGTNLTLQLAEPTGAHVYEMARYDVVVRNTGSSTAKSVQVTVDLPETNTSPTVYLMGELGAVDGRCSIAGRRLSCSVGTLKRNKSTNVWFELALPVNLAPSLITAKASGSNASLKSQSWGVTRAAYDEPVVGPAPAHVEHCTGVGLSSFYECALFPSSLSSHDIVLNADGSISFPGEDPGYTGLWQQSADNMLSMAYFYNGTMLADFAGLAAGDGCFEGLTLFFNPTIAYSSPYQVCL